ncbi:unnamed protein product [Orchesella dallaii]|uniref:Tudor domain-containing protein n=1 Tax=Orchesella dallaii TaxID=48710 RepID=A0ABP1QIW8_9HEXA
MASGNSGQSDNEIRQNILGETPPPLYDGPNVDIHPPIIPDSDNEEPRQPPVSTEQPRRNRFARASALWSPLYGIPRLNRNRDRLPLFTEPEAFNQQTEGAEGEDDPDENPPNEGGHVPENSFGNAFLLVDLEEYSLSEDSRSMPSLEGSSGPPASPTNVVDDDSSRPYPTYITSLPIKPKFPAGSIFYAFVTSVETPFDFTLIPADYTPDGLSNFMTDSAYWDNGTEHQLAEGTKYTFTSNMDLLHHGRSGMRLVRRHLPEYNSSLLTCMAPVFQLENQLHQFMERGSRYLDYQSSSFEVEIELVAIMDEDSQWHRAVVVAFNEMNEDSTGQPGMVTVRLIDHGDIQVVPLRNVCRLPQEFANLPCRLYSCSTTGIISTRRDSEWTSESKRVFRKHIQYQKVLVCVQKPPIWDEYLGATSSFERNPYLVRVGVQAENNRVVDASIHMVKIGQALPFNDYNMEIYPECEDGLHHVKYDFIARWLENLTTQQNLESGAPGGSPAPTSDSSSSQPNAAEEEEPTVAPDVGASQAGQGSS